MNPFVQELEKRVLIFDGAMGTSVHALDLDLQSAFLGKENCTEVLVLTRPEAIQGIHEGFLAAGADVVETNTFGANKLVLAEFGLEDRCREINAAAARIARTAAERFATLADGTASPRFVAGSIGPGTKLVSLGHTTWDVMFDSYAEQVRGLLDGGVDVLLIETAQDLLQIKCAINAGRHVLAERGRTTDDVPIMVQITIETTGAMLLGTQIAAAANALAGFPILSLGLNCATGPAEMAEHIHWLGRHWDRAISVQPNAGLPALVNGRTEYPLRPEPFAAALVRYVEESGVNLVGGCCGTTPEHIGALARALGRRAPVRIAKTPPPPGCSSLYDTTDYRQDNSVLIIGERTNASGSRAFKKMLEAEDFDAMVSLAREQVRENSHVLDVNVDYAGRDNARDLALVVQRLVRQVDVPLMLDSTQPATLEAGLKCAAGKCLINSANLEDGQEKFARMIGLARQYGAGIVLGCIDEDAQQAMARTADRKLAIATRMYGLATATYGLAPEDVFFDALVLPISTGMDQDRRSALETIEGVRRIAAAFPRSQTICGVSNVSFGLAPAARAILNSAFLHELEQAGLTSAILHAARIRPRRLIPEDQWQAALDLIYDRRRPGVDPLQHFIGLFPATGGPSEPGTPKPAALADLPLEERLQRHIIDGEKRGLLDTLDQARARYAPLVIINDHLLAGMKVVGELFGSGQMQLPFVLQSAEVMKMAVAHLQQYLEKASGQSRGSIVLATVKGDVHDIGKNLVDIILSNNGFTVYNLGIKQPITHIIDQWRQRRADAIGLSGLLVKSVTVMKESLEELRKQDITVPVLLGGAALSRHYCETVLRGSYGGKVYYGQDAFEGLRLMDHLTTGRGPQLDREIEQRLAKRRAVDETLAVHAAAATATTPSGSEARPVAAAAGSEAGAAAPEVAAPFWGSKVVEAIDLDQVYPFINRVALFRGQWQFRKGAKDDRQYQEQIEREVEPILAGLQRQCREEKILQPQVVYGYFPCNADGDDLIVFDPQDQDREVERFVFPRQAARGRLCLSDFFLPLASGRRDVLGLQCVTVGSEVSRRAHALFEANQYTQYLYLHGLGVESAEALAELWHKRIRQELGIDAQDSPHVRELFTQHYRGSRYSFGYPACPDLSDQEKLFRLLRPERIGCTLTENWQIEPEQSTSALIVHHPGAKYFSV
jgi:5-methyltetrahydrofolate--homocysteine methyltransferase